MVSIPRLAARAQWLTIALHTLPVRQSWAFRRFSSASSSMNKNLDDVLRIAAFADGAAGGNPAGVAIRELMPTEEDMRLIAAEVGFSETVFAQTSGEGWRVRYFSPESEVPFCGHATIALGAALAMKYGDDVFSLQLNEANITVEGRRKAGAIMGALQSPPTSSATADVDLVSEACALFGFAEGDLDARIPPALVNGGNKHLVLALKDRSTLAAMSYELDRGRTLMNRFGLVTIILVYAESSSYFHVRNPFASGGIYEDPATGSAAAAFGGYLRDLQWPHGGHIEIVQGEDMGMRSRLFADIAEEKGSSIRVSGVARVMS